MGPCFFCLRDQLETKLANFKFAQISNGHEFLEFGVRLGIVGRDYI